MLKVINVCKDFGGFKVLNGVNLDVKEGEIVAVIGPNGAGKTTLFNIITGLLKPTSGNVLFNGEEIAGLAPHVICRKGLTRSFQIVNVFPRLTVFENLQIALFANKKKCFDFFSSASRLYEDKIDAILKKIELYDKKNKESDILSHGEQKVLEIALSLCGDPKLLILDEPTAGMSKDETERCISLIKMLARDTGVTILFCEHDMRIVFDIADRIMVMVRGCTLIQDVPEKVRCNKDVQNAYLGENC